jgi:hypothetical protein
VVWTIEFVDGGPYDVVITTSGRASREGFFGFNLELVSDVRWRPGMSVLLDHSDLDTTSLTSADVEAVVELVVGLQERLGPVVCAIVAADPYSLGVAQVSVSHAEPVGSRIRTFPARAAALEWLAAPGV